MSKSPVDRRFLGWERPILHSVAEQLLDAADDRGPLDLSRMLVVFPGARAGRRLKELLVDSAAAAGRPLRPPEISTVGGLPERLYQPELPEPDPALDRQAWRLALNELDRSRLSELVSLPEDDPGGMSGVASALSGVIGALHREVSATGTGFSEVAALCRRGLPFSDHERWLVLAEVQQRYRSILARYGFRDLAASREMALAEGKLSSPLQIWIAGTPDLPPVARRFMKAVKTEEPLRILVGAPSSLASAFDSLGCVVPEEWAELHAELPDHAIRIVPGPAGQADAVIRSLCELEGEFSAEDVTVGVPDSEVVPYLTERFAEHGVQARYAAGRPLAQTGVFRLFSELAGYLEYPEFSAFGSLVRHPALERALLAKMKNPPLELSGLCDRYQALHLQARVDRGGLPAGGERGSDPLQPRIQEARDALSELLSPLAGERSLALWGPALAELLLELCGRFPPLPDRSRAEDRELRHFAEIAGIALDRFQGLPSELDSPARAHQALRFLLDQLRQEVVPPDAEEDAVELLGWLELPLDDASAMVVTGLNEPHVPRSVTSHPFLPHSLREAMGLLDNSGRWARDLLYLRTIQETRQGVALIAGRWDGEGNPILPSRLLFAEDAASVARRVRRCFKEEERQAAVEAHAAPGELESFRLPPEPVLSAEAAPDRIRVTAFRSLLRDPYRYALERVLGLARVDDEARELDGLGFGTLAHAVLERFGRDPTAGSTDASRIRNTLSRLLEREVARRFGAEPLPAVRLQVGQLRARLGAFAEWQAGWVGKGWVIRRIEASPPGGGVEFMVDGEPILLSGKLDRVDHNEETGEWCILDYKTGDRGAMPDDTHRRGPEGRRRWVDLQLPLYRLLAAALESEGGGPLIPPETQKGIFVGYVPLPRDLRVRELLATWTSDELADAEETARAVVRELRANRLVYDAEGSTIQPGEELAPVVGGGVLRMSGLEEDPGRWNE